MMAVVYKRVHWWEQGVLLGIGVAGGSVVGLGSLPKTGVFSNKGASVGRHSGTWS